MSVFKTAGNANKLRSRVGRNGVWKPLLEAVQTSVGLRRTPRAAVLGAALAWSALGPPSRADWVTLRDGRREQCVVLAEAPDWIRLMRGGGVLTVPRSEVAGVEKESAADNAVLNAEYQVGSGPLLDTLNLYVAARDQGASAQNLCRSLTRLVEYVSTEPGALNSQTQEVLAGLLSSLAGSASDSAPADFLYYSAALLTRFGSMGDAMRLFAKIPPEHFERHPERRAALADLVVGDVKRLLDEGDYDRALERIEALHALNAVRSKSCEAIVHLSRAHSLRLDGDYAGALKIYSEQLAPEFPAIAKDRARIVLAEALSKARRTGAFQEAIELIRGSGKALLGEEAVKKMLGEAQRDWGLWRLDHGDYEGARQAFREHYAAAPDEKMVLINLVEYRQRKSGLGANAPEGHYQLGKFCVGNGLLEEAETEFGLARQDPKWAELAQLQLNQLQKGGEERMLLEALELNKAGRFAEAREKASFVLQRATDPEIRETAQRVAELAEQSMAQAQARAPREAEVLLQNAERCILPEERESCLDLLSQIVRKYPETPAAKKAAAFRSSLLSRGLAEFEGRRKGESPTGLNQLNVDEEALKEATGSAESESLREETRRIQHALETLATP